ncbi:MAG: YybH family protein [Gemmatimonadota bacterium]
MRNVVPMLCASLLALPSVSLGQASSDTRAAIAEATEAWEAAWNAGDGAGIAALYTDDAMLLPPGSEPIEGREAIQAFWQSAVESGSQAELKMGEVEDFGETAIEVRGSYVVTGADGAHLDHGKYIVVWKKVDGSWKLHRDIWNSSMTP